MITVMLWDAFFVWFSPRCEYLVVGVSCRPLVLLDNKVSCFTAPLHTNFPLSICFSLSLLLFSGSSRTVFFSMPLSPFALSPQSLSPRFINKTAFFKRLVRKQRKEFAEKKKNSRSFYQGSSSVSPWPSIWIRRDARAHTASRTTLNNSHSLKPHQ